MSLTDGMAPDHWEDVRNILEGVAHDAGFVPRMVCYAEEVGVIQARIVDNIFELPLILCDVSGRNPNVMFELGMRLMADKATIIVKDDKTPYSFDTAPIEHIGYPRDLRYPLISTFKDELVRKLKATYDKSTSTPDYSPFLSHFAKVRITRRPEVEVPEQEYTTSILEQVLDRLSIIERRIAQSSGPMKSVSRSRNSDVSRKIKENMVFDLLGGLTAEDRRALATEIKSLDDLANEKFARIRDKHLNSESDGVPGLL